MINLVRAELLKMRTTRTMWGLLIGLVPYVALNAFIHVLPYLFKQPEGAPPLPPLSDPTVIRSVLSGALSAKTLVLVLGILMITSEYRHMTITPTFLSAPRRSLVVAAKLVAAAVIGLVFGVIAVVVATLTGYLSYGLKGESFSVGADRAPQAILGILVVITVYAVVGIGVGTLVSNQVAAVLIAVGWTLAAELIVTGLLTLWSHGDKIYRYFPGNAAASVTDQFQDPTFAQLSPWPGMAVLVLYGLLFATLGSRLTMSRDVT